MGARSEGWVADPGRIGTEPNGNWFSWNGKWNGGATEGTSPLHCSITTSSICGGEGAGNLQWIWHVNWFDEPEAKWNRFENYYPGAEYCDWVALSLRSAHRGGRTEAFDSRCRQPTRA